MQVLEHRGIPSFRPPVLALCQLEKVQWCSTERNNVESEEVRCSESGSDYDSEFDEDTGYATDPCPTCGHDQREYA